MRAGFVHRALIQSITPRAQHVHRVINMRAHMYVYAMRSARIYPRIYTRMYMYEYSQFIYNAVQSVAAGNTTIHIIMLDAMRVEVACVSLLSLHIAYRLYYSLHYRTKLLN